MHFGICSDNAQATEKLEAETRRLKRRDCETHGETQLEKGKEGGREGGEEGWGVGGA